MTSVPILHRPIETWPGELLPWELRKTGYFTATYSSTLDLLDRELYHLGAKRAVLQLALREQDIRNDGVPRASARPEHPGVILAFETSSLGPMQYATDNFTAWQENLRGIALGLEALRKVERYGITSNGQQYTGFRALPGRESTMTLKVAASLLAQYGMFTPGQLLQDTGGERVRQAYRAAAKVVHPDAGGNHGVWLQVEEAYRLLVAS